MFQSKTMTKINEPKILCCFLLFVKQNCISDKSTSVCHTAGCVSAAADVLKFIDTSVDPCDDFYDFSCGKFLSETTLTDDKVSVDTFSIARDKMQNQLLRLIDSPIEPNELKYSEFVDNFVCQKLIGDYFQIISIGEKFIRFVHESDAYRRDWFEIHDRNTHSTWWLAMCCW